MLRHELNKTEKFFLGIIGAMFAASEWNNPDPNAIGFAKFGVSHTPFVPFFWKGWTRFVCEGTQQPTMMTKSLARPSND